MGPYKNLRVWQMSIELTKEVYRVTAMFPKSEIFGLVSQMRRCVVSISSNIAEGYGRGSNNDLLHFLSIAVGSSNELDTQMIISKELSYLREEDFLQLATLNSDVSKMLRSLMFVRKRDEHSVWDNEQQSLMP